jgi:preprotein translocase subunit SecF
MGGWSEIRSGVLFWYFVSPAFGGDGVGSDYFAVLFVVVIIAIGMAIHFRKKKWL